MQRAKVGGAAFVLIGALAGATPGHAQATFGVDLDLFSSYVWRGLTLTNKPVAEPGLWLSFPAGNASITVGGWANIDLGTYDDINDDISESGGTSSFNLSEFDPYAEISFPAGKATLTGGVTGYIYPNDLDDAPNGGLDSEANTVEVYGKLGFDVPLSPELSVYYDVDKIKGAYIEANLSHSLAASEAVSIDLGAAAGFSAGQGVPDDLLSDESSNFADDGFTHLDLSAGVPFSAGAVSITPVIHVVIAGDDFTKFTSPSNESDTKLWGGVSLSWSNEVEEEEPEAPASPE
ncbi:MAG TPA: TorF family putative porin [Gemmatimonadales bacterium]|nr:TorF family putative porin [Gemmatimonadales bacterium]